MKLGVASPAPLVDVTRCRSTGIERFPTAGSHRRRRAQQRPRRPPAGPHPLPGARPQALLAGASGPAAQHGHHRRQPAAAHPLRLLPGRHHACNKREPGSGCSAIERLRPLPRDPRHVRALRRHPPVRPGRRAGRARRRGGVAAAPAGERRIPFDDLHRLPGDDPDRETALDRRADHRGRPARRAGRGRSIYRKVRDRASYAFALVSVAAALDVDGRRGRATCGSRSGGRAQPWRAPRRRGGAARRPATDDTLPRRPPTPNCPPAPPAARQRVQGAEMARSTLTAVLREAGPAGRPDDQRPPPGSRAHRPRPCRAWRGRAKVTGTAPYAYDQPVEDPHCNPRRRDRDDRARPASPRSHTAEARTPGRGRRDAHRLRRTSPRWTPPTATSPSCRTTRCTIADSSSAA